MITTISVLVALIGSILIIGLFVKMQTANKDLRIKKYRSSDAGLADLLNYAAVVDDGVIVGKNGSFMAAWYYQGTDNTSATDAEREVISFRINQA